MFKTTSNVNTTSPEMVVTIQIIYIYNKNKSLEFICVYYEGEICENVLKEQTKQINR